MKGNSFHKSVMLSEAIGFLQVKRGKKYIDATLGGGGHTQEILKRGGEVLGIDQDDDALNYIKNKIKSPDLRLIKGNFRNIDKLAISQRFERVAGVLYDLGISSFQIEKDSRGFSFQKEAELDMRMDPENPAPVKASDILNLASERQLYEIFTEFGEERNSRAISNAVVGARKIKAIKTTGDLLKIIEDVYGIKGEVSAKTKADIAKRVFQALRIAVNDELGSLEESLPKALELLEKEGRIVVISFQSLEDRIVKQTFLEFKNKDLGEIITKKPVLPSVSEISDNRRSRSAKMRVFEKK